MNIEKERKFLVALSILWLVAVLAGMVYLIKYRDTPGASAPQSNWPAESSIKLDDEHDTFVMFAHPRCPCSLASVSELSRLMTQAKGNLTAYVVFIKPQGMSIDWEKTELWSKASVIPGVHVLLDSDGVEAARFHGATSGQSMLYDPTGKLLFTGGITGSRGHEGDNDGRDAIISLLLKGEADRNQTPVFGCELFTPESATAKTEAK
jgi:hypothetical protein